MFIQRKQAECFEDKKKKTVNGRNVVVQIDSPENYVNVTGTSLKPLNPLSSSVMIFDMASSLSTAS